MVLLFPPTYTASQSTVCDENLESTYSWFCGHPALVRQCAQFLDGSLPGPCPHQLRVRAERQRDRRPQEELITTPDIHATTLPILPARDGLLYVAQDEWAVTYPGDPGQTKIIASSDATTCHVVIVRDPVTGAVALTHLSQLQALGTSILAKMIEKVNGLSFWLQRDRYEGEAGNGNGHPQQHPQQPPHQPHPPYQPHQAQQPQQPHQPMPQQSNQPYPGQAYGYSNGGHQQQQPSSTNGAADSGVHAAAAAQSMQGGQQANPHPGHGESPSSILNLPRMSSAENLALLQVQMGPHTAVQQIQSQSAMARLLMMRPTTHGVPGLNWPLAQAPSPSALPQLSHLSQLSHHHPQQPQQQTPQQAQQQQQQQQLHQHQVVTSSSSVYFGASNASAIGYGQALSATVEPAAKPLDLFIVGGFEDDRGVSDRLSFEILNYFATNRQPFRIQLCCIGKVNTTGAVSRAFPSQGRVASPLAYGAAMDIFTGRIFRAKYQIKGPDETLRHVKLLYADGEHDADSMEIYNYASGMVQIKEFRLRGDTPDYMEYLLSIPPTEYLKRCSTSPYVEPPGFYDLSREAMKYALNQQQNPCEYNHLTIKTRQWKRQADGHWGLF